MDNNDRLKMVMNFIHAYNNLNVEGMLQNIHEQIQFENIRGGKAELSLSGIEAFQKHAAYAAGFFKNRDEKILKICFVGDVIELTMDFYGVLARDMTEELKAGDALQLVGRSVFGFRDDKIISIKDISD